MVWGIPKPLATVLSKVSPNPGVINDFGSLLPATNEHKRQICITRSFLWDNINALRGPLRQPAIIDSPFPRPRDGPLLLRRKATSYKTGLDGIPGREKKAVRSFLGMASRESEIRPIWVRVVPAAASSSLHAKESVSPCRLSGSWSPALCKKSV